MRAAFRNEPTLDFTVPAHREAMCTALSNVEAQLGRRYPLIIGGDEVETGAWIASVNPGNLGQVVGEVASAGQDEVERAFQAAQEGFERWRRVSPKGRASTLARMAAAIRRRKLELAAWMVYELDKPWDEAEGEVAEAIDMIEWNARQMLRLAESPELARLPEEGNELRYQPMGIGVIIPPWNFPCAILTNMTTAAVVAGNAVIVKPASNTPVIGYKMVAIMREAGLPPGVVNFLPGSGAAIGDPLVDDPRTRFIAFTGSKDVGIRIFERAAKVQAGQRWLKRVTAEMGGKDTIIVDATADLDAAAEGIVTSAFGFSGQKCSACSLALVDEAVYDKVVEKIVARAKATLKVGPATDGQNNVGAVVDEKQYASILDYIEVGKREGQLRLGGGKADGNGYFIEPTIIADVATDARIAREEIFGPVLAIAKVSGVDEAFAVVNASEYGLTGSIYAQAREVLERAREEFDVGNLYLNRKCTGAIMGVHPFGGLRMSGTNTKSGGPDYLQTFLEAKVISEKF